MNFSLHFILQQQQLQQFVVVLDTYVYYNYNDLNNYTNCKKRDGQKHGPYFSQSHFREKLQILFSQRERTLHGEEVMQ